MSNSKICNDAINRVFDYIIKNRYSDTDISNLQNALRRSYAKELLRRKEAIKELKNATPIDLL